MTTRNRWIAAAVALLVALAGYFISSQKHARIGRLSRDCATIARREDWPRLEELAREWTALESSPLAWFWLGSALKEQQEWSEAKEAYSHVPVDGLRGIDAAIARMEIVYHIDQRPLVAIEMARDLLQRDAGLAAPRRHLIHFYAMTMQRPELIREIRLAIKHRADVPEHYLYLFSVEDLSFRDAEHVTARWLEATPDSPLLQQAHAMHRLRSARNESLTSPTAELMERYRQVRDEVTKGIDRQVSDPVVLDTLLMLAVDAADVDEAGRLLALVPDRAADDPVFWKYRGWYATKTEDFPQAAESYQQGLTLFPLGWQTRHEYAALLRLTGKVEEAGKVQSVSALGSELATDIRRLPHARNAPPELLSRIAKFARDCADYEVANGITRRYEPKNR